MSHVLIIKSQSSHTEGKLVTDTTSDGHTSFHTTLEIVTNKDSKPLSIKMDLGAGVNMISLSRYHKLFPKHFTKAGSLKQNTLQTATHTWVCHDEHLLQLMKTTSHKGLLFNGRKCSI